jgi:excisionase family DNA binding protein
MSRGSGRRPEPLIVNITTHPREYVGLRVAATYLGIDARTVRARIDDGRILGFRDGKAYRIPVAELRRYDATRREFGAV